MRAYIYSSCFFQRKIYILQRAIYYYVRIFFMGFDSPNEQSVFYPATQVMMVQACVACLFVLYPWVLG